MTSGGIAAFGDPDDLETALRGIGIVDLLAIRHRRFRARMTQIVLPRLRLSSVEEFQPRVAFVSPARGTLRVFLPIDNSANVVCGGAGIEAGFAGRDLMPPQDEEIVTPRPTPLAKLLRLHAAAGHLARQAPEVIANPEAARGLEQALVEAMVDCLVMPDRREDTAARRRHTLIMQRFHAALEASDDSAVYFPELCRRIGASGRTLRLCCQRHFGMSPKQYLLLRRMHLVRRALRQAVPTTTVTDIAMCFGFWELGRFSVRYKVLFGESPSATQRRYASAA